MSRCIWRTWSGSSEHRSVGEEMRVRPRNPARCPASRQRIVQRTLQLDEIGADAIAVPIQPCGSVSQRAHLSR